MGLELDSAYGQTPLSESEKEGLLISTIATREELDEFEQSNIQDAISWTLANRMRVEIFCTQKFMKQLHRRMYSHVWKWAGQFRYSNKNIGVDKYQIREDLQVLLDDTHYWVENQTYTPDELAIRFKHRLVSIHCFPNGNGRHSRLAGDVLVNHILHQPIFTWGGVSLAQDELARRRYIKALKEADDGAMQPLIEFSRS